MKPVGQLIRLTERGVARVLEGKAGMLFVVENWVGVESRCAAVLDYRYPDANAVGGYQCWVIDPEGFEIVRDTTNTEINSDPATAFSDSMGIQATVEITWDKVAYAWTGMVESGYSPWVHGFYPGEDDLSKTLKRAIDLAEGGPWYAEPTYWRDGGSAIITYDTPDDDEGDGTGRVTISPVAIRNGLNIMASKAAKHFADLLNEDGDAITDDVFAQMVVLGDIVYG